MDDIRTLDHFGKTYLPILTDILKNMDLPDNGKDFQSCVEKAFFKSATMSCKSEPDERYDEDLTDKIAYALSLGSEYNGPVRETVQKARELATKAILEAPMRIVNDFGEAADYMTAFAVDTARRSVMFGVDTGYSTKRYSIFKLPHSDRIDFFFGREDYLNPPQLSIGDEMKYLGFLDKETGILYDLREPMTSCWFHRQRDKVNHESSGELRKAISLALRSEVARRVIERVPALPETPPPEEVLQLFQVVEKDYGKGITVADLADKVDDSHIFIRENDPIRFILEPEALIAERVDEYMKRYGDEMERRWIVQRAAQKILTYTASLGYAVRKSDGAGG